MDPTYGRCYVVECGVDFNDMSTFLTKKQNQKKLDAIEVHLRPLEALLEYPEHQKISSRSLVLLKWIK